MADIFENRSSNQTVKKHLRHKTYALKKTDPQTRVFVLRDMLARTFRVKKKGFCSLQSIKQTFEFVIEVFETILRKLSDRARSARK